MDRFYIGTTTDVARRIEEHNSVKYQDSYTKKGIPCELYLSIPCESGEMGYQLERFIKRMKSRDFIKRLKEQPGMVNSILNKIT